MKAGRPSVIDKEQVLSLFKAGKNYSSIAAELGCSTKQVGRLLATCKQRDVIVDVIEDIMDETRNENMSSQHSSDAELETLVLELRAEKKRLKAEIEALKSKANDADGHEELNKKLSARDKEQKTRLEILEKQVPELKAQVERLQQTNAAHLSARPASAPLAVSSQASNARYVHKLYKPFVNMIFDIEARVSQDLNERDGELYELYGQRFHDTIIELKALNHKGLTGEEFSLSEYLGYA